MRNSIYHSESIYKRLLNLGICEKFRNTVIKHILAILISVFQPGYRGKTINFEASSPHHRTTIAHFLNQGKWDDTGLEEIIKSAVVRTIYGEAERSGQPVVCIVDDTIASKTKPSSQALHPIESAYFHQSHLKKRQDYGHQAIAVILSCNGITLNYAIIMYDKTKSKIQLVCDLAEELPAAPVISYFLCDCWYTTEKVMNAFIKRGFYSIGALKTNRIIYPFGIRQPLSRFALHLRKTDCAVRLVTVGKRQFYVFRYEGPLNGLENAVVIISWPKDAFLAPRALRAFLCTDSSLSTQDILNFYVQRWAIEVYFRQCKTKLAFDSYQVRTAKGIRRFWLLTSLAHFISCMGDGQFMPFDLAYAALQNRVLCERVSFIYLCGANHVPLGDVLSLVA